ncbi:MAG: hypothetical protein SOW59_01240, partial [Corynebacterium sp.]|nr:hypothetical protein [Corynebacterium sp.]
EKTIKRIAEFEKKTKSNVGERRNEDKEAWIEQQVALLASLHNNSFKQKDFFIPWLLATDKGSTESANFVFEKDSPLRAHGESLTSWNENWHTQYFRLSEKSISASMKEDRKFVRNLLAESGFVDEENGSGGLAQIEVFPYQTESSDDVKKVLNTKTRSALQKLRAEGKTESNDKKGSEHDRLLPSEVVIRDYLVAAMLSAEADGRIIIIRGSVTKTGNSPVWESAMKKVKEHLDIKNVEEGRESSEYQALLSRVFKFGMNCSLKVNNLSRYVDPEDLQEELKELFGSKSE